MSTTQNERFYSVRELPAAGYPVTEAFLRKLIFERRIPSYRVGRNVRIAQSDIEAFIRAGRVPAQSEVAA